MNLVGFNVERVLWGYMVEVACNDWEFMDWGKGIKVEAGCAGRAGSALGISLRWSMIVKVKVILGVDFVFEASVTE
jgi:hypothetical protein